MEPSPKGLCALNDNVYHLRFGVSDYFLLIPEQPRLPAMPYHL